MGYNIYETYSESSIRFLSHQLALDTSPRPSEVRRQVLQAILSCKVVETGTLQSISEDLLRFRRMLRDHKQSRIPCGISLSDPGRF